MLLEGMVLAKTRWMKKGVFFLLVSRKLKFAIVLRKEVFPRIYSSLDSSCRNRVISLAFDAVDRSAMADLGRDEHVAYLKYGPHEAGIVTPSCWFALSVPSSLAASANRRPRRPTYGVSVLHACGFGQVGSQGHTHPMCSSGGARRPTVGIFMPT